MSITTHCFVGKIRQLDLDKGTIRFRHEGGFDMSLECIVPIPPKHDSVLETLKRAFCSMQTVEILVGAGLIIGVDIKEE